MTPDRLVLTVAALPVGQGAISGGGTHTDHTGRVTRRAAYHSNGAKLNPWRSLVATAARDAIARTGWTTVPKPQAVELSAVFFLPRPRTVTVAKRPRPSVGGKDAHDLSHYVRGLEDALTKARVWDDDCQVTDYGQLAKRYVDPAHPAPCALVVIRVIPASESPAIDCLQESAA